MEATNKNSGIWDKATLRNLLIRIGFESSLLREASFNSNRGKERLSEYFKLETRFIDQIANAINNHPSMKGAIQRDGWKIFNPFHDGRSEEIRESNIWMENYGVPPEWKHDMEQTLDATGASEVLKRYTAALRVLLQRGELGPDDDGAGDQKKLRDLGSVVDLIKRTLYPNTASMVCDEPILYIPGEGTPSMGDRQRFHKSKEYREKIEAAGLQHFLGNKLFLSRFMSHRASMTTDEFGLRERPENTIQSSIQSLLRDPKSWGRRHSYTGFTGRHRNRSREQRLPKGPQVSCSMHVCVRRLPRDDVY